VKKLNPEARKHGDRDTEKRETITSSCRLSPDVSHSSLPLRLCVGRKLAADDSPLVLVAAGPHQCPALFDGPGRNGAVTARDQGSDSIG